MTKIEEEISKYITALQKDDDEIVASDFIFWGPDDSDYDDYGRR